MMCGPADTAAQKEETVRRGDERGLDLLRSLSNVRKPQGFMFTPETGTVRWVDYISICRKRPHEGSSNSLESRWP